MSSEKQILPVAKPLSAIIVLAESPQVIDEQTEEENQTPNTAQNIEYKLSMARRFFGETQRAFKKAKKNEDRVFKKNRKFSIETDINAAERIRRIVRPLYKEVIAFYFKDKKNDTQIAEGIQIVLEFWHSHFIDEEIYKSYLQDIEQAISLCKPNSEVKKELETLKRSVTHDYLVLQDRKVKIESQCFFEMFPEDKELKNVAKMIDHIGKLCIAHENYIGDIRNELKLVENQRASAEYTALSALLADALESYADDQYSHIRLGSNMTDTDHLDILNTVKNMYMESYKLLSKEIIKYSICYISYQIMKYYEKAELNNLDDQKRYLDEINAILDVLENPNESEEVNEDADLISVNPRLTLEEMQYIFECCEKGQRLDPSNSRYKTSLNKVLKIIGNTVSKLDESERKTELMGYLEKYKTSAAVPETEKTSQRKKQVRRINDFLGYGNEPRRRRSKKDKQSTQSEPAISSASSSEPTTTSATTTSTVIQNLATTATATASSSSSRSTTTTTTTPSSMPEITETMTISTTPKTSYSSSSTTTSTTRTPTSISNIPPVELVPALTSISQPQIQPKPKPQLQSQPSPQTPFQYQTSFQPQPQSHVQSFVQSPSQKFLQFGQKLLGLGSDLRALDSATVSNIDHQKVAKELTEFSGELVSITKETNSIQTQEQHREILGFSGKILELIAKANAAAVYGQSALAEHDGEYLSKQIMLLASGIIAHSTGYTSRVGAAMPNRMQPAFTPPPVQPIYPGFQPLQLNQTSYPIIPRNMMGSQPQAYFQPLQIYQLNNMGLGFPSPISNTSANTQHPNQGVKRPLENTVPEFQPEQKKAKYSATHHQGFFDNAQTNNSNNKPKNFVLDLTGDDEVIIKIEKPASGDEHERDRNNDNDNGFTF